MRVFPKADSVGRLVALLLGGQWLILQALLRTREMPDFVDQFFLGNDFSFLYNAAGLFLSGKSPYLDHNFVPLPPALYLPVVLHHLSFWDAVMAFRAISFFLVIAAVLWLSHELQLSSMNTAMMMLITVTYGPFYSLLAGGNLDALMMAFLVFSCARQAAVRGAFLGLSIGTKFYSVLLIPVLALRRRWRELLWATAALAVLLVPFFRYLLDALSSVTHRTAVLRLEGNESPAVLFILLFGANRVWAWRACYVALWGGTLLLRLFSDLKTPTDLQNERFKTLDYLPWMAGAPVLVFAYTGTILLPVIACVAQRNQERRLNWAEWTTAAGFLLTGFYPVMHHIVISWFLATIGAPPGRLEHLAMAVAPLGVSAMLLGSSVSAWKGIDASKGPRPVMGTASGGCFTNAPETFIVGKNLR